MKSKLILVEGLPCTGKTTIAKTVDSALKELGFNSNLYLEGNLEHPADFDGVSYFSKEEYVQLLEDYKDSQDIIQSITEAKDDYFLLSFVQGKDKYGDAFSEGLFERLARNDVYELPLNLHIDLIKKKWKQFAAKAKEDNKTYIFDCCFIQNPLTVSMIRSGSSKDVSFNYIKSLAEIVSELNPIIFYVEQIDIKKSFCKVQNERPKEWLSFFIEYYTTQGFGKKNNYSGFDGTIEILKIRKDLEKEILNHLDLNTFYIDNSCYKIEKVRKEITNYIGESF